MVLAPATASAPESLSADALPDDALLEILSRLPELPCWWACELVAKRWCGLLRTQRSRFVLPDRIHTRTTLERVLRAARNSQAPMAELCLHAIRKADNGDALVPPPLWDAKLMNKLETLVLRSCDSLTALELTGPPVRFPKPTAVVDQLLISLASTPQLRLQRLDLSWIDAASTDALGRLFAAAAAPDGSADDIVAERLADQHTAMALILQHAAMPTADGLADALMTLRRERAARPSRGQVLECLRLGGCTQLTDDILADSLELLAPQLKELSLASCSALSPEAIASLLTSCASLTSLDLSQLRLTQATLRRCLSHPGLAGGLHTLRLAGHTTLSSSAFAFALTACEALTSIDFSASLIGDDALRDAANTPGLHRFPSRLKSVNLTECSALTDAGLRELCIIGQAGASLTHLAVGGVFTKLTAEAATVIAEACAKPNSGVHLTALEMTMCPFSTPGMVKLAESVGPNLETLDLSGSGDISEESLAALLRRSGPGCGPQLSTLRLRSCDRAVTDQLLASFLPRAHALQTLDVAYCVALTDMSAVFIASGSARALKALRHLDLTGCHRITHRGRDKLRRCATDGGAALLVVGLEDSDDEEDAAAGSSQASPVDQQMLDELAERLYVSVL